MDHVEIAPNPPMPVRLIIPLDIEPTLPRRHLPVSKLLQYKFSNPFWTPHDGTGIQVWSDSPPHKIHAALLLSCMVPQWETVKQLLLEVQQLIPTP